jgi:hypothetical protein
MPFDIHNNHKQITVLVRGSANEPPISIEVDLRSERLPPEVAHEILARARSNANKQQISNDTKLRELCTAGCYRWMAIAAGNVLMLILAGFGTVCY